MIKPLPSMTNKRVSNLYCDETEFNEVKVTYKTTLKNSGTKDYWTSRNHARIKDEI